MYIPVKMQSDDIMSGRVQSTCTQFTNIPSHLKLIVNSILRVCLETKGKSYTVRSIISGPFELIMKWHRCKLLQF